MRGGTTTMSRMTKLAANLFFSSFPVMKRPTQSTGHQLKEKGTIPLSLTIYSRIVALSPPTPALVCFVNEGPKNICCDFWFNNCSIDVLEAPFTGPNIFSQRGANKTTPTFGGTPIRRVHWWDRLQLNFPWHNPEGG